MVRLPDGRQRRRWGSNYTPRVLPAPAMVINLPSRPCIPIFPEVARRLSRSAALHKLPHEMLHLIMGLLSSNEAVKLGSLHPALRSALGTLPSINASLDFDATPLRGEARTRHSIAADHRRQLRGVSFGAFTAAHPGIAIALTLQLSLRLHQLQRNYYWSVQFATDWLPLHSVRQLYIKASTYELGQAQVIAPPLV